MSTAAAHQFHRTSRSYFLMNLISLFRLVFTIFGWKEEQSRFPLFYDTYEDRQTNNPSI